MDKNLRLYYLSSFFSGLRFLVPIWLIWYTKFIPVGTVGLIESIGIIIAMFLEVPTGAFADIVGRRTSVVIGKIGVSISALFITFASNSHHLIIGVILWGVFDAFISGSNTALIYDHLLSSGREKLFSKINSMATTFMRLGIIIASFTGGYLFNLWAPLPFFLFSLTTMIEALIWFFIEEPKIDTLHFSWTSYQQMISAGFKAISHSSHIRLIYLVSIITISFASIFREELNYSFALDLGLNATNQSYLFGFSGIIKMLAVVAIGHLILRFSQNKIVYYYLFSFSSVLLLTVISGFLGGIIIILLLEMISSMAPIISDTYLNQELSSRERATSISFINMFSALTKATGLLLGMYFVGLIKSHIVFSVFGFILLFTTCIFLFFQVRITKTK